MTTFWDKPNRLATLAGERSGAKSPINFRKGRTVHIIHEHVAQPKNERFQFTNNAHTPPLSTLCLNRWVILYLQLLSCDKRSEDYYKVKELSKQTDGCSFCRLRRKGVFNKPSKIALISIQWKGKSKKEKRYMETRDLDLQTCFIWKPTRKPPNHHY